MKKFEDLLAGEVCLSIINEPPQPIQPERREEAIRESAREIADRRWRMIKREGAKQ
jgi:hypothetical protein